jgi:hydroxymethylpyrimidine kinase/phosphomethylpyrimidine kinase
MQLKTALTIAGSDPSGGAGIQADLKTFTILGVYSGAVITCNTVQNTTGVASYHPVAAELVRKQIMAVLEDIPVSHIKIGMVGSREIATAIYDALENFEGEVIWDPVLRASSGQLLTEAAGASDILEILAKQATVFTPNLPELAALTRKNIINTETMFDAALYLLDRFEKIRAILVKGGHQEGKDNAITDYLVRRKKNDDSTSSTSHEVFSETHSRIETKNDHGTGCTFASAFTAFHLLTGSERTAFAKTSALMQELLELSAAYEIGRGRGPLLHHLASRLTSA